MHRLRRHLRKQCGRVIDHGDTYFYTTEIKSCGCKQKTRRQGTGKIISAAHAKIPHVCEMCGKPFTGGTVSKFCPDCRDKHRSEWVRNYHRRRAGWTPEEIALGHRIKK